METWQKLDTILNRLASSYKDEEKERIRQEHLKALEEKERLWKL